MEIRESLNRGPGRGPGVPFPKGRSGNPAGRPPRPANVLKVRRASVHEMVRAGALAAVRIEVEGGVVEVSALEAAVREVALQAAAGDRLALVTLSRLMASTERQAPVREETGFTTPEVEVAEAYKHAWTAVLSVADGRDTGLPMPVPHPAEIAIDRASALVGFTKGPPAERLSLEPLVAAYHALRAALRERLGELELPPGERPEATRDWHAVADTIDEIDRQLRRRYRRRPMLPEIDTDAMDLAEALAAHADRAALFEGPLAVEPVAAPVEAAPEPGEASPPEAETAAAPQQAEAAIEEAGTAATDAPAGRPEAAEARAYVRICEQAMALAAGSYFDVQPPKPLPSQVHIDGLGRVACTATPGPDGGPTLANLRRWPERLEAITQELDLAIARTECAGELVRLRCRRRMVGAMRDVVVDGVADWDSGGG